MESQSDQDQSEREENNSENGPKTVPLDALIAERKKAQEKSVKFAQKVRDLEVENSQLKEALAIASKFGQELNKQEIAKLTELRKSGGLTEEQLQLAIYKMQEADQKRIQEWDQQMKAAQAKATKEAQERLEKTFLEEHRQETMVQLHSDASAAAQMFKMDPTDILTRIAYDETGKYYGKRPLEVARLLNEERQGMFGGQGQSQGNQASDHPKTIGTKNPIQKSTVDNKSVFTPDAQGIRNMIRALGKG